MKCQMSGNRRFINVEYVHSSNPNEIKKSFEVLSAPFPVGAPKGSGAGINPQFARRIFSASTQYFSPFTRLRSIPSAAALNTSAAFRKARSLLLIVSCALKALMDGIGGGFVTIVVESFGGGLGSDVEGADADGIRDWITETG